MPSPKRFKYLASSLCLPQKIVHSDEIDQLMGFAKDTTFNQSGVRQRHYVRHESAASLATTAARQALAQANLNLHAIDHIIAVSGKHGDFASQVFQQLALPTHCQTHTVQQACLGFIVALENAITRCHEGQAKRILIVSADTASNDCDWQNIAVGGLFGDGAAACIIGGATLNPEKPVQTLLCYAANLNTPDTRTHHGLCPLTQRTCSRAQSLPHCCVHYTEDALNTFGAQTLPRFVERLFNQANLSMSTIDWVVPHQASKALLTYLQTTLHIPYGKMVNIIENVGNQIAASLPTALHILVNSHKVKAGEKITLFGAGAHKQTAGLVFTY